MIHIFVDCEMNVIPKSQHPPNTPTKREIVEIGAVKLNENYQLIDKFSCFVKPEFNEITAQCTKITGITNTDVKDALTLQPSLKNFEAWIGQDQSVRFYSWNIIDETQLFGECRLKQIYPDKMPKVYRRWIDFQRIYTRLMNLSGSLSLKNAVGTASQSFAGKQHSAVADAENSASLLTLVMNKEEFAKRTATVRNTMSKQQPKGARIGDLLGDKLKNLMFE